MSKQLLVHAKKARLKSHSPYSRCKVGAAVLMSDGKIYSGCNVENSSYGATICAERTAIFKAVSEGSKKIKEILVITDATPPWPPCGMCRQVMAEFSTPQTLVHFANTRGQITTSTLSKILPFAFTPEHLTKKSRKK